jgi:hypothetical protein
MDAGRPSRRPGVLADQSRCLPRETAMARSLPNCQSAGHPLEWTTRGPRALVVPGPPRPVSPDTWPCAGPSARRPRATPRHADPESKGAWHEAARAGEMASLQPANAPFRSGGLAANGADRADADNGRREADRGIEDGRRHEPRARVRPSGRAEAHERRRSPAYDEKHGCHVAPPTREARGPGSRIAGQLCPVGVVGQCDVDGSANRPGAPSARGGAWTSAHVPHLGHFVAGTKS